MSTRRTSSLWLIPLTLTILLAACRPSPGQSAATTPELQGSVLIEDGKCCLGAVAGEEVLISVSFQAGTSVTQMRTGSGFHPFTEAELSASPWEALSTRKTFPFVAPINWTGFYVTVQFSDEAGNLSPIYSDDISVEGMPAGYPLSTP